MMEFVDAVSHEVDRKLRWMVASTSVLPDGGAFDVDDADGGLSFAPPQSPTRRRSSLAPTAAAAASPMGKQSSSQRGGGTSLALTTTVPQHHDGAGTKPRPTTKQRFAAMFLCAIFDGDCTVVRRMLEFLHRRTSIDIARFLDQDEVVPFLSAPFHVVHYAVASRSTAMLQLLLFFESDVKKVTGVVDVGGASAPPHSCTPLHMAIALCDFEMVRTLLAAGAKARALRGPVCRRISALQDALHALAEQNAGALDACVSAPVAPLYSRAGLTTPMRHPTNPKAPWMVWVRHGEEERAKIPRGAWRTDTNSFVRSRTPSPLTRHRQPDPFDLSGTTPLGVDNISSGGDEDTDGDRGEGSDQHGHHRERRMVAILRKSSLFQIAVLLLDQGAEMIFQKSGLNHTQLRRMQQVTVAVQRELHMKLVRREDTGLACVIGQGAESQHRDDDNLFASQDYDDDDIEDDHSNAHPQHNTSTRRRATSTPPNKERRALPMARLIESVTPCHTRHIGDVLAARVRHHHSDRMTMLSIRGPRLLPPMGQRRAVDVDACCGICVGSAVWVLPASRYYPARRPMDALVKGDAPTALLRRAGQPLVRNRYLVNRVVEGTNALLLAMSHTSRNPPHLADDREADHPTDARAASFLKRQRSTTSMTGYGSNGSMKSGGGGSSGCASPTADKAPMFGRNTMAGAGSNASFNIRITATTGEDVEDKELGATTTSVVLAQRQQGQGPPPPLAMPNGPSYLGHSPSRFDASIVHVTETSQLRSSGRSAVFSQAMMVGDPSTVVGCVACIVMLPDRAEAALSNALDAATSCGAWRDRPTQSAPMDGTDDDCDEGGGGGVSGGDEAPEAQSAPRKSGPPRIGPRRRQRLFAGIVVEPMYGAADGSFEVPHAQNASNDDRLSTMTHGSVLARGTQGGGGSCASTGGFGLAAAATQHATMQRDDGRSGDTQLTQTLPYCSLFVPLADLVVVEQQASVELVEHRLRKQIHVLQHALGLSQSATASGTSDNASVGVASSSPVVHRRRRHARDPHKDMIRCIERVRAADTAKDAATAARRQGRM